MRKASGASAKVSVTCGKVSGPCVGASDTLGLARTAAVGASSGVLIALYSGPTGALVSANAQHVSASAQNQALAALLFLHLRVLSVPLARPGEFTRAKRPQRVPVVLAQIEIGAVLDRMTGVPALMASLLYGAGLRLLERARLRAKDLDFERLEIVVRDGKGRKDRTTMLPERMVDPLRAHLDGVRAQHAHDVAEGRGGSSFRMPWTESTRTRHVSGRGSGSSPRRERTSIR